jgi:hypothetical protein
MLVLWTREWLLESKISFTLPLPFNPSFCSQYSTLTHHRQHLSAIKPAAESGFWVLGGAMLEDTPKEGSPLKINGSVMMAVASSKEEVMERIKSDVYTDKGVWDMDKVSLFATEEEGGERRKRGRRGRGGFEERMLMVEIDSDFPFQVGY